MKRVAVILARGAEGCGVSKFSHEQAKWLSKNAYEFRVFVMNDKKYNRSTSHDGALFTFIKFASDEAMNDMIKWCNTADYVIINSLPPKENKHTSPLPPKAYENWARALREITRPIVIVQHDHKIYSIKRNALLDEAIAASKIIFVHSMENDFVEYVDNMFPTTLQSFFEAVDTKPKIFPFQPGCSFHKDRWIDIKDQDKLHHKWIGRSTSWKGYDLMFHFSEKLRRLGALVSFEGIDKSPGYLAIKGNYDFHGFVGSKLEHITEVDITPYYGDKPVVFSGFVNDKMLNRMARCGFGYQTSVLKPRFIERSIEYTHCEMMNAGVVPVFRQEYGEECIHRITGDPLIDSVGNYTIWLNYDNQESAVNTIERLTNDSVMRDEWRQGAFEFYKVHQDSDYTFREMTYRIEHELKI